MDKPDAATMPECKPCRLRNPHHRRDIPITPAAAGNDAVTKPILPLPVVPPMKRRQFLTATTSAVAATTSSMVVAGLGPFATRTAAADNLSEPVHRVANAASAPQSTAVHPLDTALRIARDTLEHSRKNVRDYTATLVKRETIAGTLGEHEFMTIKFRNRKLSGGKIVTPMSVYLGFLKPSAIKGREVIYVENRNEGNMVAHEGGFKGRFLPTVTLPPTGMLAMRGQRYPVTEIGLENLLLKLIERGGRARKTPDVQCEFRKNARVKDRMCTVIQVTQPTPSPTNEFHIAQIFMDDALGLPIRYAAYDYPTGNAAQGNVIEEYTYLNLAVNVGLTDKDFDQNNASYAFK